MSDGVVFLKGHGTGNDFVILPDAAGTLELTEGRIASVCDRRFGIGADGILRAVRSEDARVPEWMTAGADWFMDYRNADGSVAEMCGNGARVFARYLVGSGSVPAGEFIIGTRGGPRAVQAEAEGPVSVVMGAVDVREPDSTRVALGESSWSATPAFAPNPHAVAFVDSVQVLGDIEGSRPLGDAFPDGVNIEFVQVEAPDRIRMRVNERGSGETLSCGTGACAAAAVHRAIGGQAPGDTIVVQVPGGEVLVRLQDGDAVLIGPAVLVAEGLIARDWWEMR